MKKSVISIFLAFVFLTALLSGCAPASTSVPPTFTPSPVPPTFTPEPTATPVVYNVEIDVTDENGNPIPEAKIIQGETNEFADHQGVWRKSMQDSAFSANIWAQGYLLKEQSSTLQAGDNKISVELSVDPLGLQTADLTREGYKLIFVEDFQDNISDCAIDGNGAVIPDDTDSGNQLLLVDLRGLEEGFSCSFGPTNIENAIIEVSFRYPAIQFTDFKDPDYFNWQGYYIQFRDGFDVEGYPLQVSWGATLQIRDFTTSEWKYPIFIKQGIKENQWYTLNTLYDGKKVEVRMNGGLRFTFLNPPTMNNTKQSSFGAFSKAFIQFDNIKMWIPSD
ncbi:MAG: hypothetical protein DYG85_13750 [Chloroflexi bacterium CFX1]|nr:hypothetical protein [Chloroflexi bacterium CFX1]MDL1920062.1 hypothetical protein [Chloroflexi bacterium CFX5]